MEPLIDERMRAAVLLLTRSNLRASAASSRAALPEPHDAPWRVVLAVSGLLAAAVAKGGNMHASIVFVFVIVIVDGVGWWG